MSSDQNVQGEGFEILGHQAPESKAEEPEQEAPAEQPEAAAAAAPEGEPTIPYKLDVYSVMGVSIHQFAALAWQKMGLQADPFTNQVEKDMEQARVAIDLVTLLAERLRPHLQGQEARDLDNLLTDLRLNFLRQSGGSA